MRPTPASEAAGRPALTPELLAATGARYSRSNAGLGAILAKIDPANLDASVDAIFRMVDYGHQSIADMAPVALFLDDLSLWLAYVVWSLCPTAGGQESSTRYIHLTDTLLPPAAELGIPPPLREEWTAAMQSAFAAYGQALAWWEALGVRQPALTQLPAALLADPADAARKRVARLRRNYAFDRARYFLPAAARTNVMLIMSARGWAALCQHLGASLQPEAVALCAAIRAELALAAPRLLRHAEAKPSSVQGLRGEFDSLRAIAAGGLPPHLRPEAAAPCPCTATLDVLAPPDAPGAEAFAGDLAHHDNRYAWIGAGLRRTAVRFGWEAMALAEIRDLNRHRTGAKYAPLRPLGFYAAEEQLPAADAEEGAALLAGLGAAARQLSARAHALLAAGDPTYVYWTLLGTQYRFEHVTTADKFIYEAELRTGTGAHFQYARHLREALACWYARFPATRGLILEGTAEPE